MIPDVPACACVIRVVAAVSIRITHEQDWVRRAGVVVAFAGTWEAAPGGVASLWRLLRSRAARGRRVLARALPFLHGRPVSISGPAGSAMSLGGDAIARPSFTWPRPALVRTRLRRLERAADVLAAQLGVIQQDTHDRIRDLKDELLAELDEMRKTDSGIIDHIRDVEASANQSDGRGILVLGLGVLLTGLSGELARCPLVGWGFAAVSLAVTLEVGRRVVHDWRRRKEQPSL